MGKQKAIDYFVCPFHQKKAEEDLGGLMMVREESNYQVKANREYQDSVLTDLFCRWRRADEYRLALHNALHDTNYTKEELELRDIRLAPSLYKGYCNDLSYEALYLGAGKSQQEPAENPAHILGYDKVSFVFGEHQSTINENMPLRYLSYAARSYESVLETGCGIIEGVSHCQTVNSMFFIQEKRTTRRKRFFGCRMHCVMRTRRRFHWRSR